MTSAKSLTRSRGVSIYLHALKSNIGLMVSMFLLFFVSGPLPLLISSLSKLAALKAYGADTLQSNSSSAFGRSYSADNFIVLVLMVLLAGLVVGLISSSFMHNKTAMDVYGALPIKRESLVLAKLLAGASALVIPYVLAVFSAFAIQGILNAYNTNPFIWLDYMSAPLVFALAIYVLTFFCAVCTGSVFDTAVFTLALCGVPSMILALWESLLTACLIGYNSIVGMSLVYKISPLTMAIYRLLGYENATSFPAKSFINNDLNIISYIIYPLVVIAIGALILPIYKRRRTEIAGTSKPNGIMQSVMKAMASLLLGMIVMFLFVGLMSNTWYSAAIGFVLGAFIAYFIAEAVLARGFKTFKRMLSRFGIFAAACTVVIIVIYSGGFGYSKRVPSMEKIASADISYEGQLPNSYITRKISQQPDSLKFTEPEVINQILAVHKAIAESDKFYSLRNATNDNGDVVRDGISSEYLTITYKLKNGSIVQRTFQCIPTSAQEKMYELNGISDFRLKNSFFSNADLNELSLTIYTLSLTEGDSGTKVLSKEQSKKLADAVLADIKNLTLEQIMNPPERELATLNISIMLDSETPFATTDELSFRLYPWCTNTIAALDALGLPVNTAPDYSSIEKVYVVPDAANGQIVYTPDHVIHNGGIVSMESFSMLMYDLYYSIERENNPDLEYYGKEDYMTANANAKALQYLEKYAVTDKTEIASLIKSGVKSFYMKPGERPSGLYIPIAVSGAEPGVLYVAPYLLPANRLK